MIEEKTTDVLSWLNQGNIKFRIRTIDDSKSIVWALMEGVDLCFTILFYDFIERVADKYNFDIHIDSSWKVMSIF